MRSILVAVLAVVSLSLASCTCPRCPEDSADGVGVSLPSIPSSAELGALYSVFQLLAAQAGPEAPEMQALDIAMGRRDVLIGIFQTGRKSQAGVRGYTLLKTGKIALDSRYARAARPNSEYMRDARTWPFVLYLYASGWRLANGGSYEESVQAARVFGADLADALLRGEHTDVLPPGTHASALASALRGWRQQS